jgi:hypothetical protein
MSLLVTRLLPNPPGKDRPPFGPPSNEQLNKEWIQFLNVSGTDLKMDGVALLHTTFSGSCRKVGTETLITFKGNMPKGSSIRVHSGSGEAWTEGDLRHIYANHANYAWNNVCGDCAEIRAVTGGRIDWAEYRPYPPEGVVLNREPGTNLLTPTAYRQTA